MSKDSERINTAPTGLTDIYRACRADFSEASVGDRAILGSALVGVGFEWSSGNEALLGMTGGAIHDATENPIITSLGTAGVSTFEQLTLGTLMASAISRFPRVGKSIRQIVATARSQAAEAKGSRKVTRFLSAFALGAAVDLAIANSQREYSRAENQKRVVASAAMIGAGVAVVSGGASAALKVGAEHGFERESEVAVNVIASPWTYVSLFAASLGYNKIKGLIDRRRSSKRQIAVSAIGGDVVHKADAADQVDAAPNRSKAFSFDAYRELCDKEGGLVRAGVTMPEVYHHLLVDETTKFRVIDGKEVPIISSIDPFHIPERGEPPRRTEEKSAVVPLTLIPPDLRHGIVTTRQFLLTPGQVDQIVSPKSGSRLQIHDVPKFFEGMVEGEPIQGHGEPQFTVLSKYDVSQCEHLRTVAPTDIITRGGHTLTTDKKAILEHLPELVALQENIFKRQASRIGYYDGMVGDIIEHFLQDDSFIGAAAFDKDTGKPFMFALFASGLEGLNQIPWLNREVVEELIEEDGGGSNPTLALPVIIAAKFNGIGVFAETVSLALHEILFRTQEKQTMYALYNSNLQSVLYTPRIINSSTTRGGAKLLDTIIEASVTTKLP